MLRFLVDENFNNDIVRGVLRREPAIDLVRIQDVGLSGADDPTVLEWAAQDGRILRTHDVTTITKFAYERIVAGSLMPGVFEIRRVLPVGRAIDELLFLLEASSPNDWDAQVVYLPIT